MLRIRIKPADVRRSDGERLRGDEQPNELINHGGRVLSADETPDGYGKVKPGATIAAPAEWYAQRKHWHFLEVLEGDAPDSASDAAESTDSDLTELRDAYEAASHNRLGKALKALGADVPKSKSERLEAAAAFLGD